MAPIAQKRRRDEKEERRPKKKFKKVKRVDYHSSDEDDEVEGAAYDAPKVSEVARVVQQGPVATGENLKPILKRAPLKQAEIVEEMPAEEEQEEDAVEEDDEDGFEDELARNTALNSIPPARDAPDSEDSEDDQDAEAGAEDLADLEAEADENDEPALESSADEDDDSETDDDQSQTSSTTRTKKKRNDPTAFATSITRILDTKLTSKKRPDPILSRSTTANEANKALSDNRLEARARAQIRAERKAALDKGRVTDVLGLKTAAGLATGSIDNAEGRVDTGKVLEEEKRLKKTAQRGVVKLFNAVRAAQVKGEEALRQARSEGVVGMRQREERVSEMSKQGFLDLISGGGGRKEGSVEV